MTARFIRLGSDTEQDISDPEKELKVLGGWFQAGDVLELRFYGKLESLD